MWEFDWGLVEPKLGKKHLNQPAGQVLVVPTFWEEHCTECAVPECYSICELYSRRRDGGCHRFTGGIRRVPGAGRPYGDGAKIRFERWGKLQTLIPQSTCSLSTYRLVQVLDRITRFIDHGLGPRWSRSQFSKAWKWRRAELVASMGSKPIDWSRCHLEAVIENLGDPVGVSVELVDEKIGVARNALSIPTGISHHRLTAEELGIRSDRTGDHLRISADGDDPHELCFLRLEILQNSDFSMSGSENIEEIAIESSPNPPTSSPPDPNPDPPNSDGHEPRDTETFSPAHAEFLVSCEIELRLETNLSETQVDRMVQLLARSDNLNLSSRRYDKSSFMAGLSPSSTWIAGTCRDRFGDYGLVLAARTVINESILEVEDLVVSCRVAEKAIENAFFEWLRTGGVGIKPRRVTAAFIPSPKNAPIEKSLRQCGFKPDDEDITMWIDGSIPVPASDIVRSVDRSQVPD